MLNSYGLSKISNLFQGKGSSIGLLSPRFFVDLRGGLGKLWELADFFKLINGDTLLIISQHPALYWEVRLRKREILEYFKNYGIREIRIQRTIR